MMKKLENKPILNPTNDYVFKRVFGYKGNEIITGGFIEAVTGEKYENIELTGTPILDRELMNDKLGILDVKVETGEVQVDIEMQVSESAYVAERMLF